MRQGFWRGALAPVYGVISAVLVGCGGGSGSGSSVEQPPPASSVSFSGTVLKLGPGNATVAEVGGREVRLRSVDEEGEAGVVLATTKTSADGSYKFDAVPGAEAGLGLMVEADDADGNVMRAFALDGEVDVGPASEAVTRELLLAASTRGAAFSESVPRLARIQRAWAQFLDLIDLHATDGEAAVLELRGWMADDPATQAAIQSLGTTGRLPTSIGDIGSMHRLGSAAWETADAEGLLTTVLHFRPESGEYDVFESRPSHAFQGLDGPPDGLIRLEDDGATYVVTPEMRSSDATVVAFAHIVGPLRVARFGQAKGTSESLTNTAGKTIGYTFDSDQTEEDFSYTADRRVIGIEQVDVNGEMIRALKVEQIDRLTITLSGGGRIEAVSTSLAWHVPFIGAVRTASSVTLTDAAGASSTASSEQTVTRAAVNGMSWPGRVLVKSHTISWPGETNELHPIAVNPDRTIVYAEGSDVGWPASLRLADPASGREKARFVLRDVPIGQPSFVQVSADGSKVYAALSSQTAACSGEYSVCDEPIDAADARGGVVVRLDAGTLAEEMRITLPAHRSPLNSGRGFARAWISDLLVSPNEPTHFLVASGGVLLYRGDQPAPSVLIDPQAGRLFDRFDPNHIRPLLWDGTTDEIRFNYTPVDPRLPPGQYRAPIAANGLALADAQAAAPLLQDEPVSWSPHSTTRFTADRIYLNDFTIIADKASGRLRAHIESSVATRSYFSSQCHFRRSDILCIDSDGLLERSAVDLSAVRRLPWQSDLRVLGQSALYAQSYLFRAVAPSEYVGAAGNWGGDRGASNVSVIKVWPR